MVKLLVTILKIIRLLFHKNGFQFKILTKQLSFKKKKNNMIKYKMLELIIMEILKR